MELVINYVYEDSCNGFTRYNPENKFEPMDWDDREKWGCYEVIGFASPLACPLNVPFFALTDAISAEERGVYLYGQSINQRE